MTTRNWGCTRRQFLGQAAGAAAFTIVPRYVLGGPRFVAPSEKLGTLPYFPLEGLGIQRAALWEIG